MTTNNGVVFNTEGPIMSGTWYNPNTGDSFTVRDSFFENNQFMVSTMDGRIMTYEQIQYYVQSDKPIEQQPSIHNDIPKEITDMLETSNESGILVDDQALINGNLFAPSPIETSYFIPEQSTSKLVLSDNFPIIEKALSKTELPEIVVDLKWKSYPEREIEMLKDIMDVPVSEIVDWYISKFGIDEIKKLVTNSINSYFNIDKSNNEEELNAVITKPKKISKKNKT